MYQSIFLAQIRLGMLCVLNSKNKGVLTHVKFGSPSTSLMNVTFRHRAIGQIALLTSLVLQHLR